MYSFAVNPFGQPVTYDNGNSTGIVGAGQYDNWENRVREPTQPFSGEGVRIG